MKRRIGMVLLVVLLMTVLCTAVTTVFADPNPAGTQLEILGDYPWTDGSKDEIDFPIYLGLDLGGNIFQWSDVVKVYVKNFDAMEAEYGGEPSWTVTDTSQNVIDYTWASDSYVGKNGRVYGRLSSKPTQTGTEEITVTCTWGGQTASKKIKVQVINPDFAFPTGVDNLPDEIETQVGQTLTIAPTLLPAGWNGNNETPRVFVANRLGQFASVKSDNTDSKDYNILTAGTFTDRVGIMNGTIVVVKSVTFKVKNEDGDLPSGKLDTESREVTWYTGLSMGSSAGRVYSVSSIGQMWMSESVRDYSDTNIQWELVHVSGPDNFELSYSPSADWKESYFYAEAQPKSGSLTLGTSVYTMRATYKGVAYEGTLTIHTVDDPVPTGATFRAYKTDASGSTIGDEVAFSDGVLLVKNGESYYLNGVFDNSTISADHQWINSWYHDGAERKDRWTGATTSTICHSNTERFIVNKLGEIEASVTLSQEDSNVEAYFPFKLNSTETGGETVPDVYTVTMTTDGNGTAKADPTSGVEGTQVTLTATPNDGYQFKSWDVVSGNVTIADNKFTIGTANVEIKAIFEKIPPTIYTVTVTTDGHGSAAADPASGATGTQVTLTAAPADGYQFKSWEVISGGVTISDNKFTIGTANVEIKANFEQIPPPETIYTVTVTTDGNGSAVADPASGVAGTHVTLTATPNDGYVFKVWEVISGGVTIAENQFTIGTANVEIKAIFETETVVVSGGAVAEIDPESGKVTITGTEDKNVTSVTIPATVTDSRGVQHKVTAISNSAFKNCKKLKTVTVGKNVTSIGKNAFSGCSKLKTVSGGSNLIAIADGAFQNCTALKEVTIGKKVTSIGKNAFSGCKKLQTITVKSTKLETIGKKAFKGIDANAVFKCPKKKVAAYEELIRKAGAPKTVVIE